MGGECLHEDIIVTMGESGGGGIDGFDRLERIALEHDV